jgi:hypothetical protein
MGVKWSIGCACVRVIEINGHIEKVRWVDWRWGRREGGKRDAKKEKRC